MNDIDDQIAASGYHIRELGEQLGEMLDNYGVHYLGEALPAIKELRKLLVETTVLIEKAEWDRRGKNIDTSDTQPCLLCNDQYPHASEYARGIRWEPVPGRRFCGPGKGGDDEGLGAGPAQTGWVYICWECAIGLEKVLHGQLSSLSYTFLFSHSPKTRALVAQNVSPITEVL